jgi:hypothetical protein
MRREVVRVETWAEARVVMAWQMAVVKWSLRKFYGLREANCVLLW